MGEAKRRRQHLQQFTRQVRECHGNTEWFVVRGKDLLDLCNPKHPRQQALDPVAGFLKQLSTRKNPALCIACDHSIGPGHLLPYAFVLQLPWNWNQPGDTVAVVSPVCPDCASKSDQELVQIAAKVGYGDSMTLTVLQPG